MNRRGQDGEKRTKTWQIMRSVLGETPEALGLKRRDRQLENQGSKREVRRVGIKYWQGVGGVSLERISRIWPIFVICIHGLVGA